LSDAGTAAGHQRYLTLEPSHEGVLLGRKKRYRGGDRAPSRALKGILGTSVE
jgi:hypothetical protein